MSQPDPSARPSQVTVAGWAIAIASVLLVVAVFDTMGRLESVDMRERLTGTVTSGSARDLGLSVADAIEILRWCLYVSGVAAAASGILGVFVLQRNRGARIGLTVAAVSIVLTASFTGDFPAFLGMLIGAGTALLWTRPARDWFAGRPITVRRPAPGPERGQFQSTPPSRPLDWTPPAVGRAQPPPMPGWGQVPIASPWPGMAPGQVVTSDRPAQVRLACILTWVFSGLTALGYLAVLIALTVDSNALIDRLKESPSWQSSFDEETVVTVAAVVSVVFVVWSLAAGLLAVLAWRRVRWAWLLLVVSASIAGLVCVLAFPFSVPHLAAIGASAGMLMRRPTRDWYAVTPIPRPPWPPVQGPPQGPPQAPGPKPPVW